MPSSDALQIPKVGDYKGYIDWLRNLHITILREYIDYNAPDLSLLESTLQHYFPAIVVTTLIKSTNFVKQYCDLKQQHIEIARKLIGGLEKISLINNDPHNLVVALQQMIKCIEGGSDLVKTVAQSSLRMSLESGRLAQTLLTSRRYLTVVRKSIAEADNYDFLFVPSARYKQFINFFSEHLQRYIDADSKASQTINAQYADAAQQTWSEHSTVIAPVVATVLFWLTGGGSVPTLLLSGSIGAKFSGYFGSDTVSSAKKEMAISLQKEINDSIIADFTVINSRDDVLQSIKLMRQLITLAVDRTTAECNIPRYFSKDSGRLLPMLAFMERFMQALQNVPAQEIEDQSWELTEVAAVVEPTVVESQDKDWELMVVEYRPVPAVVHEEFLHGDDARVDTDELIIKYLAELDPLQFAEFDAEMQEIASQAMDEERAYAWQQSFLQLMPYVATVLANLIDAVGVEVERRQQLLAVELPDEQTVDASDDEQRPLSAASTNKGVSPAPEEPAAAASAPVVKAMIGVGLHSGQHRTNKPKKQRNVKGRRGR